MDVFRLNMRKVLQNTLKNRGRAFQSISGNKGAFVRRETQGSWEHFFLATYWQDLQSVKAFAGENYHVAVTYPDDEEFKLLSDPYVFQHVVEAISPL